MKKSLLTLFAALVVFAASAQIEKGAILIGGASNLGFTSYDEDAGDYSLFNVDVKGGYFVMDNLAIGLDLSYSKDSDDDDALVGIGPLVRYYVNGKIILGIGYNIINYGDLDGSSLPLEVGYAAFINKAIAIEPTLNYQMYGGDLDGSSFGVNVGISFYLNRGE